MKIAFVRGPFLNPWELQSYGPIAGRHSFTAIGAGYQFYAKPIQAPGISIQKAGVWGETLGRASPSAFVFCNRSMSWTMGRSYGLTGIERTLAEADVLHAAEPHFTMTYQCLQWKRRHGGALVLTVWENLPHAGERHPWRRRRKYEVLREADGFLAVTQTTARLLRSEGAPADRIATIPMSVDLRRFSPGFRNPALAAKFGLHAEDFVILFIGRFAPEKGIADLLECIPRIAQAHRDRSIRFLFVGAGPLEPLLRQGQARAPEQILVRPFVDYGEIPQLHQMADLFVLPSRPTPKWQEQFGYVLIESMACGKPVISTRTGSIPDVVGDAGLLVEPGHPQALGDAILALIQDEKTRAALGAKALERARRLFDAQRNAPLIEGFYESALERARRS